MRSGERQRREVQRRRHRPWQPFPIGSMLWRLDRRFTSPACRHSTFTRSTQRDIAPSIREHTRTGPADLPEPAHRDIAVRPLPALLIRCSPSICSTNKPRSRSSIDSATAERTRRRHTSRRPRRIDSAATRAGWVGSADRRSSTSPCGGQVGQNQSGNGSSSSANWLAHIASHRTILTPV